MIPCRLAAAALFVFVSLAATPGAASWPEPSFGEGFGVQIKEGRTGEDEMKKIKAAGLSYVRFVIPWYEVEKPKDHFRWDVFDSVMRRLRKHGLKSVIVLGGGHPAYTGFIEAPKGNLDHIDYTLAAPSSPESIEAFARYAAQTVSHFGTEDIVWELWNEPDSDRFWAPRANVGDYIAMADAACRAIRQAAPEARIVGPGMADTPGRFGHLIPGFLGKVLLSPVSSCLDAVSVHPYRDGERPPENVASAYEKLRDYVKAFTPKGQNPLPIVSTEWGFTLTHVSPEEQADFLLRSFLMNSLEGVPLSIWYEWRDAREGEGDPEAHFGLLTLRKEEKESYKALAAFLPPLKGARLEKRWVLGGEADFILSFLHPDGRRSLVFWSAAARPKGRIVVEGGESFDLSSRPQRVDLGEGSPSLSFEVRP